MYSCFVSRVWYIWIHTLKHVGHSMLKQIRNCTIVRSIRKTTTVGLHIRYRTLFPYKPGPMPSFFRHTLRSRIQNLNLSWGLQMFLVHFILGWCQLWAQCWGPQKRLKFWILDLKVCLKKLGIGSGLYGKSVLYLLFLYDLMLWQNCPWKD